MLGGLNRKFFKNCVTHTSSSDWLIVVSLSDVLLRGLETCIKVRLSGNTFREIVEMLIALERKLYTASKAGEMCVCMCVLKSTNFDFLFSKFFCKFTHVSA